MTFLNGTGNASRRCARWQWTMVGLLCGALLVPAEAILGQARKPVAAPMTVSELSRSGMVIHALSYSFSQAPTEPATQQPAKITLRPARIKKGKETVLEAMVTDEQDKPIPGAEVLFLLKFVKGSPNLIGGSTAKTNSLGVAKMPVSAGKTMGNFQVTAQVPGTNLSTTGAVKVVSAGLLGTGLSMPIAAAVAGGIATAIAVPVINKNRDRGQVTPTGVSLNPGSVSVTPPSKRKR